MVRAEICSEVEGSNKMISPLPLPEIDVCQNLFLGRPDAASGTGVYTKGDIAIAHPGCDSKRFKCSESRYLLASKQIPDNGSLASIIAHYETASSSFTDVVDRNKGDALLVTHKTSLHG